VPVAVCAVLSGYQCKPVRRVRVPRAHAPSLEVFWARIQSKARWAKLSRHRTVSLTPNDAGRWAVIVYAVALSLLLQNTPYSVLSVDSRRRRAISGTIFLLSTGSSLLHRRKFAGGNSLPTNKSLLIKEVHRTVAFVGHCAPRTQDCGQGSTTAKQTAYRLVMICAIRRQTGIRTNFEEWPLARHECLHSRGRTP
jgi:hypothetical protein